MTMHVLQLYYLALTVCIIGGAPFAPEDICPSQCVCTDVSGHLSARCPSLAFMDVTPVKRLNNIGALDLSRANLTKIGRALKKLHGLKSIDLSHNALRVFPHLHGLAKLTHVSLRANDIKRVDVGDIPKSVQHLDLARNRLAEIPDLLSAHTRLTQLNVAENPFVCSCDLKNKCEQFERSGVLLVKEVTCRDSEGRVHKVREWDCNAFDSNELMQGDQPEEGSGTIDEDIETEEHHHEVKPTEEVNDIEQEELLPTVPSDNDYEEEDEGGEEEGSGEGSGDALIIPTEETPLKACNFNCTVPLSIEDDERYNNSSEPNPSIFDELGKAFGDIFGSSEEEMNSTEVTEEPMVVDVVPELETRKSDKGVPVDADEKDKMAITEAEANEVKKAGNPMGISNNMIIVVALIIVMLCIIVYTILMKRRKRARKSRRAGTPVHEEEMKQLKKPTSKANGNSGGNATAGAPAVPEKVPLMNGQNGNANGNSKPVADQEEEEPQLREHRPADPLLPEAHRVTVHAKELSAPKTPMLVNRMRSHDGQIITTPDPHQHM